MGIFKKIGIFISISFTTITALLIIGWVIIYSQIFQSEQLHETVKNTELFSTYQSELKTIEGQFWENVKSNQNIHTDIIQKELPQIEQAKHWDKQLNTIEKILTPIYEIGQYWIWIGIGLICWNITLFFLLKWDEYEFSYIKGVCKYIAWGIFIYIGSGFVLYTSQFFLQLPEEIQRVCQEICKKTIYMLIFLELPVLSLWLFSHIKEYTQEKK